MFRPPNSPGSPAERSRASAKSRVLAPVFPLPPFVPALFATALLATMVFVLVLFVPRLSAPRLFPPALFSLTCPAPEFRSEGTGPVLPRDDAGPLFTASGTNTLVTTSEDPSRCVCQMRSGTARGASTGLYCGVMTSAAARISWSFVVLGIRPPVQPRISTSNTASASDTEARDTFFARFTVLPAVSRAMPVAESCR